jgi:hypothetical protein
MIGAEKAVGIIRADTSLVNLAPEVSTMPRHNILLICPQHDDDITILWGHGACPVA